MKFYLLLLNFFMLSSSYASFDVLGGVSFNIPKSTDTSIHKKNAFSYNAGLLYKFDSSSDYSLRTGLLYQRKSGEIKKKGMELTFDLDYLTVPLTFMYDLDKSLKLICGVNVSYLLAEDITMKTGEQPFKDSEPMVTSFALGGEERVYKDFYIEGYLEQSLTVLFKRLDVLSFNVNVVYNFF